MRPEFPEIPQKLLIQSKDGLHSVYEPITGRILTETVIKEFAETYCKGFLDTMESARNSIPTQGDEVEDLNHWFAYLLGIKDAYQALHGYKKRQMFSDAKIKGE